MAVDSVFNTGVCLFVSEIHFLQEKRLCQKVVNMCVNSVVQRRQAVILEDPNLRVRVISDLLHDFL